MKNLLFVFIVLVAGCHTAKKFEQPVWTAYDEADLIAKNAKNENRRLRYKLIQSRISDKNILWQAVAPQLRGFSEQDYLRLSPLILDKDIPVIQAAVADGRLNYAQLVQWYLYRIVRYENDSATALNNIIAINPNAVAEARQRDRNRSAGQHPIYGMPVLLKDNVGTSQMPTTAGAQALQNNYTRDAFITTQLKTNGAIILGKTNLTNGQISCAWSARMGTVPLADKH